MGSDPDRRKVFQRLFFFWIDQIGQRDDFLRRYRPVRHVDLRLFSFLANSASAKL
jgi:hypothetical protein